MLLAENGKSQGSGDSELVKECPEALWGMRVSAGTISDLNQKLYEQIEQWRNQPITGEYPYLYLDGICLTRSWAGEVRNVSVLVAVGGRDRWVPGDSGGRGRAEGRHGEVATVSDSCEGSRPDGCAVDRLGQVPGSGRGGGASSTRRPAGSGAWCADIATSSARFPRARSRRWRRCSRRSTPRRMRRRPRRRRRLSWRN